MNGIRANLGTGIDISGLDAVEEHLGHTVTFDVNKSWLEESLGGLETLATDLDDAAIGKLDS